MLCQHNLMFSQWFEEICWHTLSPQCSHHLLVDLRVPWRAPFNQTISMSVPTFTVPWTCVGMKLASPQRPPCCCFVHLLAQGLADPWGCVFPRQDGGLGLSAASAAEMATVSSDDRRREVLWALFQSLPATELPGPQLAYFSKSPGLRDWREAGASLDGNTAKFRASCSKLGGFFFLEYMLIDGCVSWPTSTDLKSCFWHVISSIIIDLRAENFLSFSHYCSGAHDTLSSYVLL